MRRIALSQRNPASDSPHPDLLPQAGEGAFIVLDRGALRFLDPAGFAAEMPFVAVPSLPFIAAVELGVGDLAATQRYLAQQGLATHALPDGRVALPLPPAVGGTLVFGSGI
jgi:hypothetical protein